MIITQNKASHRNVNNIMKVCKDPQYTKRFKNCPDFEQIAKSIALKKKIKGEDIQFNEQNLH